MIKILSMLVMFSLASLSYAHTEWDNNPGHLIKTSIKWKGEVECERPTRFECFSSPYWGLRAMMKNLQTYRDRYKHTTIQQIIRRWAPPNENDTTLLTRNACTWLAHDCSMPFDLHNRHNFIDMVKSILRQEGNTLVYSDWAFNTIADRYLKFKSGHRGWSMSKKRQSRRDRHLRDEHGITEEEFQNMLTAQGGVCYICKTDTPKGRTKFHIDHNHETGEIRGILCHNCNIGLGHFKDDPDLLYAGIKYLMRPPVEQGRYIPPLQGQQENKEGT